MLIHKMGVIEISVPPPELRPYSPKHNREIGIEVRILNDLGFDDRIAESGSKNIPLVTLFPKINLLEN